MNYDLMFSSNSNEWETPQDFYNMLNKEFDFDLDPCCTEQNKKCEKHFTIFENGLAQDWSGHTIFMNPPYGREIGVWVKKAYEESRKPNTTVVCLIPARTDTNYWHDYIFGKAKDIRFIRGRLKFGCCKNAAPFPSAVIVFSN